MSLCPLCGAYSPRSCDLIDDALCCPWEEAEEEGLSIATEIDDEEDFPA